MVPAALRASCWLTGQLPGQLCPALLALCQLGRPLGGPPVLTLPTCSWGLLLCQDRRC